MMNDVRKNDGRAPGARRGILAMIALSTVIAGGAAVAADSCGIRFNIGHGSWRTHGGWGRPVASTAAWERAQFRAGFDAGATQGLVRGYQDAVGRRAACERTPPCAGERTACWVRGYEAAWIEAYRKGYRFGEHACAEHAF